LERISSTQPERNDALFIKNTDLNSSVSPTRKSGRIMASHFSNAKMKNNPT
jgi:hypothetical protein